jgi:hypothetical protein
MRRALWLLPVLLPLGACYEPPSNGNYGYAQPGYPQPGYPPAGYAQPGYPPPTYEGYTAVQSDPYGEAYPGYSYNDGAPTFLDAGVTVPLVFFGGAWGYYDHTHHWHRAPDRVARDLDTRRRDGDWHRGGGDPVHFNPALQPRPGQPGGQAAFHPPPQAVPGGRPDGRPDGGPHWTQPAQPQPAAAPHWQQPTPAAGPHWQQPTPAAAPHAAPAAPPPQQDHGAWHCPPGQRC